MALRHRQQTVKGGEGGEGLCQMPWTCREVRQLSLARGLGFSASRGLQTGEPPGLNCLVRIRIVWEKEWRLRRDGAGAYCGQYARAV